MSAVHTCLLQYYTYILWPDHDTPDWRKHQPNGYSVVFPWFSRCPLVIYPWSSRGVKRTRRSHSVNSPRHTTPPPIPDKFVDKKMLCHQHPPHFLPPSPTSPNDTNVNPMVRPLSSRGLPVLTPWSSRGLPVFTQWRVTTDVSMH